MTKVPDYPIFYLARSLSTRSPSCWTPGYYGVKEGNRLLAQCTRRLVLRNASLCNGSRVIAEDFLHVSPRMLVAVGAKAEFIWRSATRTFVVDTEYSCGSSVATASPISEWDM